MLSCSFGERVGGRGRKIFYFLFEKKGARGVEESERKCEERGEGS